MKKTLKFIIIFLIGFGGGVAGMFASSYLQSAFKPSQTVTKKTAPSTSVSKVKYKNETSVTEAVKKVQDAVVSVINYQNNPNSSSILGNDDKSDEFAVAGEGSGVIYKKEGQTAYVVTNNHVVAGAEKLDIQLSSGEKIEGKVIGADTYSDIAVIKISSSKVTSIAEFGDSDSISVGEIAIAIGSPLGTVYANSVTQGIISSLNRTVNFQTEDGQNISTNAIQTDTAINPGNSGGPLVNIQGQVIGINSSKILSRSNSRVGISIEGLGFAIPSNDVVAIINQLEENGKVIRPAIGIQMANVAKLSSHQISVAGLDSSKITSGVLVISAQAGLPADGKFKKFDVITAIDGKEIKTSSDLQSVLYKHKINDTIEVTYIRDGKEGKVKIKLTHSTDDLKS